MTTQRLGGNFAPPLTDELLDRYGELTASLPASPVKDALATLHRLCKHWWDLPEPEGTARTLHPLVAYDVVGEGGAIVNKPAPMIVAMSDEHKTALWEEIPWDHELDAMQALLDGVEKDAAERNSALAQDWTRNVINHIVARHFPDNLMLYSQLAEAMKGGGKWLELLAVQERARIDEALRACRACDMAIRVALSRKHYPPIPRPAFEPTPQRDAAMHMLWHARELARDREPITADKL